MPVIDLDSPIQLVPCGMPGDLDALSGRAHACDRMRIAVTECVTLVSPCGFAGSDDDPYCWLIEPEGISFPCGCTSFSPGNSFNVLDPSGDPNQIRRLKHHWQDPSCLWRDTPICAGGTYAYYARDNCAPPPDYTAGFALKWLISTYPPSRVMWVVCWSEYPPYVGDGFGVFFARVPLSNYRWRDTHVIENEASRCFWYYGGGPTSPWSVFTVGEGGGRIRLTGFSQGDCP